MVCVVGVRFKLAGKVYYFDPGDLPVAQGDWVIVETVRGIEYGEVVIGPKMVPEDEVVQPLKKVIRIGTDRDAQIAEANKRKEKDAFAIALQKIEAHNLDMFLVDVEYTFDGSKIIFYFTAEGRVDFRELVRDLASVFRTRIEMRQIGVRDEAKLLGGIGPCGRVLCCTSFLGEFAPVSIRMAKDQNLALNPAKISGLCGRLMCCLRFEQETYEAAKKDPTLAPGYVPPPEPAPVFELQPEPEPEPEEMPEIKWRMEPADPAPAQAEVGAPDEEDAARIAGAEDEEQPAAEIRSGRKSRRRSRRKRKRKETPAAADAQARGERGHAAAARAEGDPAERSQARGGQGAPGQQQRRSARRRRRRRRPAAAAGGAHPVSGGPAAREAGG
nr:MAG: hypothetical protein DIU55_07105 [Bacillota bacterium]